MHMGNTINLVMPPGICGSFEEGSFYATRYLFGAPLETQTILSVLVIMNNLQCYIKCFA